MDYYWRGVAVSDEFHAAEGEEYNRNAWARYGDGFLFMYRMGGPLDAPVP